MRKVTQGLKTYPLMPTMKAPACRTLLMLIMSEPDTIRKGFLQIRYIGQEIIGHSAKNMAFDYPVRSLGDQARKQQKQIEYQDNTDRIEVERRFSLTKRCYGMGKIVTRLEDTQLTSIALSVFVANIVRMQQRILSALFYLLDILKFREGWLPACAG